VTANWKKILNKKKKYIYIYMYTYTCICIYLYWPNFFLIMERNAFSLSFEFCCLISNKCTDSFERDILCVSALSKCWYAKLCGNGCFYSLSDSFGGISSGCLSPGSPCRGGEWFGPSGSACFCRHVLWSRPRKIWYVSPYCLQGKPGS
jgi:hypothetical protein